MKRQYYIAGRILEISADFEPEISDKIEQFKTEGNKPDFTICFEKTDHLSHPQTPNISNDYDSRISAHEESDGIVQVFHEGCPGLPGCRSVGLFIQPSVSHPRDEGVGEHGAA